MSCSFCRFLIVLSCLILSVLSTIVEFQALAQETLFWVVSFLKLPFECFFMQIPVVVLKHFSTAGGDSAS